MPPSRHRSRNQQITQSQFPGPFLRQANFLIRRAAGDVRHVPGFEGRAVLGHEVEAGLGQFGGQPFEDGAGAAIEVVGHDQVADQKAVGGRRVLVHGGRDRDLLRDQHRAIGAAILERNADAARTAAHAHLAYLRSATREIREAEAKLGISLRRLEGGGLSNPKTGR